MIFYYVLLVGILPTSFCWMTDGTSTPLILAWGIIGLLHFAAWMSCMLVDGWTSKTWTVFWVMASCGLLARFTPVGVHLL